MGNFIQHALKKHCSGKLLTLPSKAGEDRPFKTITSPVNSTLVTYYPPPSKNITQGEQKSVHITQIKNTIIRK